jgi:sugar phosphate isomerase/epimerase
VSTWAPKWQPDNVPDDFLAYFSTSVDDFLRIADQLACESLSAICTFPVGELSIDELVEPFAELCRRADGLRVDLEFVPIWGLPDLESAWRVVKEADAPNGGILFDFWHFFRSKPDVELLESIPTAKIHAVQACDAMLTRGEGRTQLQDCLEDRLPLGWGEFPVDDILRTLADKGALGRVGPEYFSSKMDGLSPSQVAENVDDTYWSRVGPLGVTRSQ